MRGFSLKGVNNLILAVIVLSLVVPMAFIGGVVLGNSLSDGFSLAIDSISSWVSAIATVAIAVLTFILAKETWYLRAAQILQIEQIQKENIRPQVSMALVPSRASFQLLELHISNHGRGLARNVRFNFTGDDEGGLLAEKLLALGAVKNGISTLGVSQLYTSYILNFIGLKGKDGRDPFEESLNVIVSYEDVDGTRYRDSFTLDLASFKGVIQVGGGDPLYKISKELESIGKLIKGMKSNLGGRLSVDVHDAKDREEERRDQEEWLDQARKNLFSDSENK